MKFFSHQKIVKAAEDRLYQSNFVRVDRMVFVKNYNKTALSWIGLSVLRRSSEIVMNPNVGIHNKSVEEYVNSLREVSFREGEFPTLCFWQGLDGGVEDNFASNKSGKNYDIVEYIDYVVNVCTWICDEYSDPRNLLPEFEMLSNSQSIYAMRYFAVLALYSSPILAFEYANAKLEDYKKTMPAQYEEFRKFVDSARERGIR